MLPQSADRSAPPAGRRGKMTWLDTADNAVPATLRRCKPMRTVMAGLLALSLGGLALAADDPKPGGGQPQSRADRLKALRDEQAKPVAEYRKELESAKTTEEKQAAART